MVPQYWRTKKGFHSTSSSNASLSQFQRKQLRSLVSMSSSTSLLRPFYYGIITRYLIVLLLKLKRIGNGNEGMSILQQSLVRFGFKTINGHFGFLDDSIHREWTTSNSEWKESKPNLQVCKCLPVRRATNNSCGGGTTFLLWRGKQSKTAHRTSCCCEVVESTKEKVQEGRREGQMALKEILHLPE